MAAPRKGELGSNRVDRGVHSFESTTAYGTPVEYGLSEQSEQYNSRSPEMVEILRTINTEEGLLACTGGIAILIMDYILGAIRDAPNLEHLGKHCDLAPMLTPRIAVKLSQRSSRIPSSAHIPHGSLAVVHARRQGAFGQIYFGNSAGDAVAIKQPTGNYSKIKVTRAVLKELMLGLLLNHPHVLTPIGATDTLFPGSLCIISPWMICGTLREYVSITTDGTREIPRLLTELADALSYIHSIDIVHGDLRVPNILVDGGGHIRVGDFGMSGFNGSSAESSSPQVTGAVGYLAPEIIAPESFGLPELPRSTFMTDVFAYGSVCYEVLEGHPPFSGIFFAQVVWKVLQGRRCAKPPDVTPELWDLVERCWAHSPKERPNALHVLSLARNITSAFHA
ncbi:hypothetical protein NLI96_g2678 [Meripilus lineatus]|uniref:Protein kinase domain-containing protein n=1 Tax=Meripilus lineatus TaxID=2056292 RepID=A0AAD5V862_9APHY|nr:hypothetical protein NLI96_g2678 [Physisporinus lineatus]